VAVWRSGNSMHLAYQRSYCTLNPVSSGMDDHLQAAIPLQCVTGDLGQLSLAIPPWVGAMSTGDGFGRR